MSLTINTAAAKDLGQRVILKGRLDTITAPDLEVELDQIVSKPIKLLIFDLGDLEYISSAGLRVIFKAAKQMREKGGKSGLLKMQPQIQKVFDIVKALPDVPVFKDDDEMDDYLSHMQQQVLEGE